MSTAAMFLIVDLITVKLGNREHQNYFWKGREK